MRPELLWLPEPAASWTAALNTLPAEMAAATAGNAAVPFACVRGVGAIGGVSKHRLGGRAIVRITHGTVDGFAAQAGFRAHHGRMT